MNALRLIESVRANGGSIDLVGGKLVARNFPANMLDNLKAAKLEIIRLLSPLEPKPITPRPALRFRLADGKGGTVLGDFDELLASLLRDLHLKWPHELTEVWHTDQLIYPSVISG